MITLAFCLAHARDKSVEVYVRRRAPSRPTGTRCAIPSPLHVSRISSDPAALLLFYDLDQLITGIRNRSFLLLDDGRSANPMINLRREPHDHLHVAIS